MRLLRNRGRFAAASTLTAAAVLSLATTAPAAAGTHGQPQHLFRVFDDRPNVLLITADDAAPGDLKYMPRTEKLLAARGVTFTDAISPDPICVPARASILTGQYAHNHHDYTISGTGGGVQSFNSHRTLPVWLQAAGYDTLFLGKYLNGYGEAEDADPTDIPPGWTEWRPTWGMSTYNFMHPTLNINGSLHTYHEYNSRLLREQSQGLLELPCRRRRPWFMWVNYVAPHRGGPREDDDPQRLYPDDPSAWVPTTHPAPRDRGTFAGIGLPRNPSMFQSVPTEPSDGNPVPTLRQEMFRVAFEQRIEALQSVDRAVGRTVATLRRTHQLANTVIIFDSDNGFLIGQHNRFGKLLHFDESERVPMVMAGPGIPKGVKVRTAIADSDIPTTIAAIAHARPMRPQDGVNFLPLLKEGTRDRIIPVEAYPVTGATHPIYTGIREGPWTYVHWTGDGGFEEMYDRTHDRFEMHNLAEDPRYRRQFLRFRRLNHRYRYCAGATCPKHVVKPSRLPLLYGQ